MTLQKGLLAVSFGTSYPETRRRTIEAIENKLRAAFPDRRFCRAWTSGMLRRKLERTENVRIPSVEEALEQMATEGVADVLVQPTHLLAISIAVAIEQFGYGFGFTAYMLYMMYFSEGEFKTAHYAICTAFMALSMMIPGMFAGYIQESLGYVNFFWMVMVCCIATVVVTVLARRRVDPEYGRK